MQLLLEANPANTATDLEVHYAVDGAAMVGLTVSPCVANMVGSLHSSGLVGFLDAAGLAAVVAACDDESQARTLVPLVTLVTAERERSLVVATSVAGLASSSALHNVAIQVVVRP